MEMTGVRALFVDTNTLIYATNSAVPWHRAATEALARGRGSSVDLVISRQIVREYLSAATRASSTGTGLSLSAIMRNVHNFRADFRVVAETEAVLDVLLDLMQTVPIAGKQVHDANIVATMQVYGISHLLTHNVADFARFSRFITVVPLESSP